MADVLTNFGVNPDLFYLDIVLPVGISFYTFQTLSYTLDIYMGRSRPWGSFLDYALYVTFFPQLVAGPIVRAADFLLRGISLDTYKHATWTTRNYYRDSEIYQLPHRRHTRGAASHDEIVQDIVLEPIDTRVLFYMPRLTELRSATPNLDDVYYHPASGTFSSRSSNGVSLRYIVRSRVPARVSTRSGDRSYFFAPQSRSASASSMAFRGISPTSSLPDTRSPLSSACLTTSSKAT